MTTRSPIVASGSETSSASRSSGVQRQPTTVTASAWRRRRGADRDREVAADHLAEVARRRQLMVQASVDDQKRLPPGVLAVQDPGHVDAAFADDVATQLEHHARLRKAGANHVVEQAGEVLADRGQVEGPVPFEIRDPEAAADVEVADRLRRGVRQPQRQRHRRAAPRRGSPRSGSGSRRRRGTPGPRGRPRPGV